MHILSLVDFKMLVAKHSTCLLMILSEVSLTGIQAPSFHTKMSLVKLFGIVEVEV